MSADSNGREPWPSAAVILVRTSSAPEGGLEVYLVRRHKKAGFMSGAYVFPGGVAEAGDENLRATAARELEEEAGVAVEPDALHYFAHWITPSVEPRRYSAQFFVAVMPAGQTAAFDNRETEDELWIAPEAALARAAELRLPPPQIRSLLEIAVVAEAGVPGLLALCAERAAAPHAILPRACSGEAGLSLLLPWDPDYAARGEGAALPMPADHPLATGPSRFVLEGTGWLHTDPPPRS
jgi:8-oxo-dGTP pyrophosphatase MutT (NUDIX family)